MVMKNIFHPKLSSFSIQNDNNDHLVSWMQMKLTQCYKIYLSRWILQQKANKAGNDQGLSACMSLFDPHLFNNCELLQLKSGLHESLMHWANRLIRHIEVENWSSHWSINHCACIVSLPLSGDLCGEIYQLCVWPGSAAEVCYVCLLEAPLINEKIPQIISFHSFCISDKFNKQWRVNRF